MNTPLAVVRSGSVGLVLWALFAAAPARAEDKPARKVSVCGTAVTSTVPDVVIWRLTITDTDRSLLDAKVRSDRKLAALLGLKDELRIDAGDIQTGQLSIRRVFERDSHGNETAFKHFAIAREITIKQRDVSRFDEFLTRFISNAEVELDFSFDSSRRLELREETRLAAVRAARAKAEAMTGVLGARLGEVLTIDEVASSGGWWSGSFHTNFDRPDPASRAPADVTGGTFAPGAIEVKITVEISFAILPGPPGESSRTK